MNNTRVIAVDRFVPISDAAKRNAEMLSEYRHLESVLKTLDPMHEFYDTWAARADRLRQDLAG